MRITYHCPSGHKMKRVKEAFGDKVWRCTGLVKKLDKKGNIIIKDGKPELTRCIKDRAWAHIDPYNARG